MSGRAGDLRGELLETCPHVRVVDSSVCSSDRSLRLYLNYRSLGLLRKPYLGTRLRNKICVELLFLRVVQACILLTRSCANDFAIVRVLARGSDLRARGTAALMIPVGQDRRSGHRLFGRDYLDASSGAL